MGRARTQEDAEVLRDGDEESIESPDGDGDATIADAKEDDSNSSSSSSSSRVAMDIDHEEDSEQGSRTVPLLPFPLLHHRLHPARLAHMRANVRREQALHSRHFHS